MWLWVVGETIVNRISQNILTMFGLSLYDLENAVVYFHRNESLLSCTVPSPLPKELNKIQHSLHLWGYNTCTTALLLLHITDKNFADIRYSQCQTNRLRTVTLYLYTKAAVELQVEIR